MVLTQVLITNIFFAKAVVNKLDEEVSLLSSILNKSDTDLSHEHELIQVEQESLLIINPL